MREQTLTSLQTLPRDVERDSILAIRIWNLRFRQGWNMQWWCSTMKNPLHSYQLFPTIQHPRHAIPRVLQSKRRTSFVSSDASSGSIYCHARITVDLIAKLVPRLCCWGGEYLDVNFPKTFGKRHYKVTPGQPTWALEQVASS